MKNEANLTPMNTLIKSISWLWLLTGIIVGLIGVWSGSLYFMFAGYKNSFESLRANNEVLNNVLNVIDALPIIASVIIIMAVACTIVGINFPRYKKWALPAVEVLSYLIICGFAALLVLWVKVWLFSFQNASDTSSSVWEIIGLVTGSIVCMFFIFVFIYVLRSIKNKTFKQLYNERIEAVNGKR